MSFQQENDAALLIQEQIQGSALNIIQPVLEQAMVLAAGYAKACGRDILLGKDMEYAMKYCAMNQVGKNTGSLFPEIYEEDTDSEDELEIIDEDEEDIEFTRYSGREYKYVKMNMAYDSWEEWVPKNPTEQMLKNAIDSNEHL